MLIETPDKEVLNKAKMAEFNRVASTGAAKNWIEELSKQTLAHEAAYHPRKRARKQKDAQAFYAALGAFAADLLLNYENVESAGFMYRPFHRERLAETLVSGTNFEDLADYWCELGWLERTGHIHASEDFEGAKTLGYRKARRYRATKAFVDAAQSFQITPSAVPDNFDIEISASDLVQVRSKIAKRLKRYGGTGSSVRIKGKRAQEQIAVMERLNAAMADHRYSLRDTPIMRRLFNCADRQGFDFNLGGRFYCQSADNWIDKPKEERKEITIDGEPTTEVDVSASQLFILYAMHGEKLAYAPDPYAIEGYPREIIKQVIVTMIGAGKRPNRWPEKFNADYRARHARMPNEDYKLKNVVAAVVKKHPILEELRTDKLDWANLQFEEAECFLSAMLELHDKHSIPSLPVHDSLIVRQSDGEVAIGALERAYESRLDFAPKMILK